MHARIALGIVILGAALVVSPVMALVSLALTAAAWVTMDAIFRTAYRSFAVSVRRTPER